MYKTSLQLKPQRPCLVLMGRVQAATIPQSTMFCAAHTKSAVILFPVIYDIILGMTDGINRMNTTRGILQLTVANMFTTALVPGLGLAVAVSGACSPG
jgi:hypothetical protein